MTPENSLGDLRPDSAALVGIGMTELTRRSGKSVLRLAVEAALQAIADAGLTPGDIDGVATYQLGDSVSALELGATLGLPIINWYLELEQGGSGGAAAVGAAAQAVESGQARNVLVFRAMNGRSGVRMGRWGSTLAATGWRQWTLPYGYMSPPQFFAIWAQRHMAVYGSTSLDFGRVAVTLRDHAQLNPGAVFYGRPMTLDDHQKSRIITTPFRLFDCCQETDGAAAVIVAGARSALDCPHPPVYVSAALNAAGPRSMHPFLEWPDHSQMALAYFADSVFHRAGLAREDIDVALLYDGFSCAVIFQLEDLGFVAKGEAAAFVADGNIKLGGRLPVNTNGGLLSEGYVHGLNNLVEAVRQLRHECGARQVAGAKTAVVTGGEGTRVSMLVLRS
jgi:acetyl-CoA acetyltransferase